MIHGEAKNVLWAGATSEYEKVIRQALTKALNNAASEFASDEFDKAIKGKWSDIDTKFIREAGGHIINCHLKKWKLVEKVTAKKIDLTPVLVGYDEIAR